MAQLATERCISATRQAQVDTEAYLTSLAKRGQFYSDEFLARHNAEADAMAARDDGDSEDGDFYDSGYE